MPLISPKATYNDGDLILAIEEEHWPEETRVGQYGSHLTENPLLDLMLAEMRLGMGASYHLIRIKGALYFGPQFYAGIGFHVPRGLNSRMIPSDRVVGKVVGNLDLNDRNEVKDFLRSFIKQRREFLTRQFCDMFHRGEPTEQSLFF